MPSKPRQEHGERPTKKARIDESHVKHTAPTGKRKDARIFSANQRRSNKSQEPILPTPKAPSKLSSVKKRRTLKETSPSTSYLPKDFKIIVGSYERLLYGLEGSFFDKAGNYEPKPTLNPIFIFPAHVSSLKAVAASPEGGKWLATGSSDEIIKVWDLRRRKEIGGLVHHQGSITHLSFPSRSYMVSASEDGTICLFRARDWVVLRTLKGHKGRVNCVTVHPSGKVALSVGKDRTLHMWDLMRGTGSAGTKLGKEGELVRWSLKGDRFVVQAQKSIDVYSTAGILPPQQFKLTDMNTQKMSLLHTWTHPSRIHDLRFCRKLDGDGDRDGELLLVAGEDKKITIYDADASATSWPIIAELTGHTNRVKALDIMDVALPETAASPKKSTTIVTTASSDGLINLYDLTALSTRSNDTKLEINPISTYNTNGSRLICCAFAEGEPSEVVKVLGKRAAAAENTDRDGSASDDEDDGGVAASSPIHQDDGGDEDEENDDASEEKDDSEEDE